jgi:phage anti-repressor protein
MDISDLESKSVNIKFKSHSTYDVLENGSIQKKRDKKRVEAETWTFDKEFYSTEQQLSLIREILNNGCLPNTDLGKLIAQQIKKKMSGYKQQDQLKKLYNAEMFLTFQSLIEKMIECELKCYYCCKEMHILYDIQRESSQWSVDRIDNDLGHNTNNYYLACLECNLKRRRRSDTKFLITKQLKIVKQE